MWISILHAQHLALRWPFLFLADTVIQYKSCAQACNTCHEWSSRWLCNSRLISLISVKKKWLLLLHTGQTGVKLSLDLFHILTHVLYIFLVLEKKKLDCWFTCQLHLVIKLQQQKWAFVWLICSSESYTEVEHMRLIYSGKWLDIYAILKNVWVSLHYITF